MNDLVFAWGNPSRGDDGLGPAFAAAIEATYAAEIAAGALEVLTDFQLQVEHALDLKGRRRVYLVDATKEQVPFLLRRLEAARDESFTTHALSPAALLHTLQRLDPSAAPECWLLTIGGDRFELGEALGVRAEANLARALAAFAVHLHT